MKKEFRTTDLQFAVVLYALGQKFLKAEGISNKKDFVFEGSDKIEEIKEDYFAHKLRIDPMSLMDSMRTLKSALYNL
jgi:hypothetical protein